jgi:osmotically-inducible protein OsmY
MVTSNVSAPELSVSHEAESRLRGSSHLFLRHVRCGFDEGRLQLDGKVPSFYLKQLAQALVQSVDGVERIDNRLTVVNSFGRSE